MDERYRIEGVDACRLESHSDFVTLPRIYTLMNLKSGKIHRLKLPKSTAWTVGAVVKLPPSRILMHAV